PSTLSRTVAFTATDASGTSPQAKRGVTITAVNDAPVASAQASLTTTQGTPVSGKVTATDAEGDKITFAVVYGSETGGSVTPNARTGEFTFTPTQDFNGPASFQFTANDGKATSQPAKVTIDVSAVNDAPTITAPGTVVTSVDQPFTFEKGN